MRAARARAKEDPSLRLDARVALAVETLHKPRKLREVREASNARGRVGVVRVVSRGHLGTSRAWRRCCARFADAIDRRRTSPCSPRRTNSSSGSARTRTGPRWRCSRRGIPSRSSPNTCRCAGIDPSFVASATRTLVNLCGEPSRAAEVARTGKIFARVRSIAEIMTNTVDVHRHRRLTYIEQARPEKARKGRRGRRRWRRASGACEGWWRASRRTPRRRRARRGPRRTRRR